ncbi:MAG: peptidoglycan-binding domain-containing protein, partial [Verrucomicrobiota bacterium]
GYSVASRTEILKRAQGRLKSNGFYWGQIDGTPGPGTQKSIIQWQDHLSLNKNGILDLSTLKSLGLEGIAPLADVKESVVKKETTRPPKVQPLSAPAEKANPERGNMSVDEFIRRAKMLENR